MFITAETLNDVRAVIETYDDLIARAIEVVSTPGVVFFHPVTDGDSPRLILDGDSAFLIWRSYESDYDNGGYMKDENAEFPAEFLWLDGDEFRAHQEALVAANKERDEKVAAVQEAAARDRQEANERAEWDRLRAKFEGAPI